MQNNAQLLLMLIVVVMMNSLQHHHHLMAFGSPLVMPSCPDECQCNGQLLSNITVTCSSYDFLKQSIPSKQLLSIRHLIITNSGLKHIDQRLKNLKELRLLDLSNNNITSLSGFPYLPKLESLNLSGNHLKTVQFSDLPLNLMNLDVSNNFIYDITKNWTTLNKLKTFKFDKNPINCNCEAISVFNNLLSSGIELFQIPHCHHPEELRNRPLNSINCSLIIDNLLNSLMVADEPASYVDDGDDHQDNTETDEVDEEGFIPATDIELKRKVETENKPQEEEGSGDIIEGSGSGDYDLTTVLPDIVLDFNDENDETVEVPEACVINCSTVKPVGNEDDKNDKPLPSLREQFGIIYDDLFRINNIDFNNISDTSTNEPETSTMTTTTSTTTETSDEAEVIVEPPVIIKHVGKSLGELSESVSVNGTNNSVGEVSSATDVKLGSYYIYIIIGVVVILVIMYVLYKVSRKNRNSSRNRRPNNIKSSENGVSEEMKVLKRDGLEQTPDDNDKVVDNDSKLPESLPLINGHNGKMNGDDNGVSDNNKKNGNAPSSIKDNYRNDDDEKEDNNDDVEMRVKPSDDKDVLLTPQLERVRITAGEIPDSVPRTPMFIHRQINSDGEIITTRVPAK